MATVQRKTEPPLRPRQARVRRDWSKTIFYILSVVIVLSMVMGSIALLFQ